MDMSKYKSLFVSDTAEHLDVLEQNLVDLEKKPKDIELLREVFRHLHSIKGMASSMGYGEMAVLAHCLEDLIDIHQNKKTSLCDEEIDLLLDGLDTLRDQLKQVEQDRSLTSADSKLLMDIRNASGKPAKSQDKSGTDGTECPQPEKSEKSGPQQSKDENDGFVEYKLNAVVPPDCDIPALRAFLAVKRLSEIGEIIRSEPDLTQLLSGRFDGDRIQLWLATNRPLDAIEKQLDALSGLDSWTVKVVEQDQQGSDTDKGVIHNLPSGEAGLDQVKAKHVEIGTVRISTDLLDFFVDSVGELITLRSYLEELSVPLDSPSLNEGVRRLNQVVRKLQDRVMEVRMVPMSLLTHRIPRVCRDLARKQEKLVEVRIQGADVKLDRNLVEALDVPVLHILRNAIDHGIEPTEIRVSSGKPRQGCIELNIQRDSDRVMMTIRDDGQGIDTARVLEHADYREQILPEGVEIDKDAALDLIFKPGLSTREEVSEISGRGVGLDVVRSSLLDIGGSVKVTSEPGKGACFLLDLPLTLAIVHVLLVEIEDYLLALPASRVLQVAKMDPSRIEESNGNRSIQIGEKFYPLFDLLALLDNRNTAADHRGESEIALIGDADRPMAALTIGRITGHREIVLKKVGSIIKAIGPFNGSAILGDGRPVLVMDLDEVMKRAMLIGKGD